MSDGRVHVGASTNDVMSGNMDIMAGVAARVISHSILMMELSKERALEKAERARVSNGSHSHSHRAPSSIQYQFLFTPGVRLS